MIRPLTIATCLMACGSGLYLYQSKHEVQLLDRTIERTVHETAALREQSRLLAAEWTMLNDPERLRRFADTYLDLKPIAPSQFTSLSDLDTRLPAPRAEGPSHGADEPVTAAPPEASDPARRTDPSPATGVATEEVLPVPPIPATPQAPAVASVTRPVESSVTRPVESSVTRPVGSSVTHPAELSVMRPVELKAPDRVVVSHPSVALVQARPAAIADARPTDQRQRPPEQHAAPRAAEAHVETRAVVAPPSRPIVPGAPRPSPARGVANAAPVPLPSRPAVVAASGPYGGSLLGMAHGSTPPAPRPDPVNAFNDAN